MPRHPAERFLQESSARREPSPDEALVALARRALDSIVAMLTVLDPSGLAGDDEDGTLMSPSALVGMPGDSRPHTTRFMMQGPLTAALACVESLREKPAEWVVFHVDDLVSRNGVPERSLRLCVQRRQDAATAIFDQRYESPRKGKPFARVGGLEFKRWVAPLLP